MEEGRRTERIKKKRASGGDLESSSQGTSVRQKGNFRRSSGEVWESFRELSGGARAGAGGGESGSGASLRSRTDSRGWRGLIYYAEGLKGWRAGRVAGGRGEEARG